MHDRLNNAWTLPGMAARPLVVAVLMIAALVLAAGAGGAASYLGEPREGYKIFVIGDSLAGGLWAGLTRQIREDDRLSVTGRFKEDSGLARPEIYDWPRAMQGILERNQFDIAVVMIGLFVVLAGAGRVQRRLRQPGQRRGERIALRGPRRGVRGR